MSTRCIANVIPSVPTSDGAGVKLRRSLGARSTLRLDPFLLLDEFSSDRADDYIGGFPPHPHRGFETVTYMLDGHMLHEDHLGNRGHLTPGSVQWMTAGRGIIHSEIPQQREGRMRGFQLWINLPAKEKMKPAAWRDVPPDEIPVVELVGGGRVTVIAGTLLAGGTETSGPIRGLTTDPIYFDVALQPGGRFEQHVVGDRNAFLYAYEGGIEVGGQPLARHQAGILSAGDRIEVDSPEGARFLLLAGKPIGERVVQHGPFVMNTAEEIDQALSDYRDGRLTGPPVDL